MGVMTTRDGTMATTRDLYPLCRPANIVVNSCLGLCEITRANYKVSYKAFINMIALFNVFTASSGGDLEKFPLETHPYCKRVNNDSISHALVYQVLTFL